MEVTDFTDANYSVFSEASLMKRELYFVELQQANQWEPCHLFGLTLCRVPSDLTFSDFL